MSISRYVAPSVLLMLVGCASPDLPMKISVELPAGTSKENAVFAAQLGYEVYAFDTSKEAKIKADKLAEADILQ